MNKAYILRLEEYKNRNKDVDFQIFGDFDDAVKAYVKSKLVDTDKQIIKMDSITFRGFGEEHNCDNLISLFKVNKKDIWKRAYEMEVKK